MLTIYLIALAIGGTLLVATLLLGGDHDADADVDVDVGADVDMDVDVGGADMDMDVDAVEVAGDVDGDVEVGHGVGADLATWLPVVSLRFWTFFSAFFGLTGAALTVAEAGAGKVTTAVVSALVGYVCGMGVMMAFRKMRGAQTSSAISREDYIGAGATVLVTVAKGQMGKIRLTLKGRTIDVLARTEDERPLAAKEQAMVYAVTDEGHALITRAGDKSE
ncbi:hypothetical protein [Haliangium sp.]|uniref:hypothetical protein n=1 Tax=Haliangium sp. TaxID=2663208 RepID=UPI003D150CD0